MEPISIPELAASPRISLVLRRSSRVHQDNKNPKAQNEPRCDAKCLPCHTSSAEHCNRCNNCSSKGSDKRCKKHGYEMHFVTHG
eukprot:5876358-Amphidinium_carterae.1